MNGQERSERVKNCNTTIDGEQYYTSNNRALAGDALSVPFLLSSVAISLILTLCFGYTTYSQYQVSQWTLGTFCLFIVFLICLCSCLNSAMEVKTTQDDIANITNAKDARPCYSERDHKMIA
jgi:hypothetical protein